MRTLFLRLTRATSKACAALLSGVVAIALAAGSDVALGQVSTGTSALPPLFTVIDLHPDGFRTSVALGVSGGQQVGTGQTEQEDLEHALLWGGTAASEVDFFSPPIRRASSDWGLPWATGGIC